MLFLNRLACLGSWVTNAKFGDHHSFNNQQKVRVDMFMDIINNKNAKPDMNSILPFLVAEKDMAGMYLQSENLKWLEVINKPDILIMDNFSELVDKKIVHKNGSTFCGYHSDFTDEAFLDGYLIDRGLLPEEELYESYDNFFNYIKSKWNIPIIFMHFPTTFETRESYIKQGISITTVLNDISTKYNFQNIHADINEIEQKDDLTYHFTQRTVQNMANKIIW